MTLGETILRLRNDRGLSQGDLAERLNVSRQSVSKWELDASTPDLDKLVAMSNFFGVTLDELVKGEKAEQTAPPRQEPQPDAPAQIGGTQRIIGFILLALGLFTAVLGIGINPAFLILAVYPLVCGIICLTVKCHAGLVLGWGSFVLALIYMRWATGITLGWIFSIPFYALGMWVQILIAWAMWVVLIVLMIATLRRMPYRRHVPLVLGWLVFWYTRGYIGAVFNREAFLSFRLMGCGALLLLPLLLFFTGRLIYRYYKKKKVA